MRMLGLIATLAFTANAIQGTQLVAQSSPLHGTLTPGGYGVGFTKIRIVDSSRPSRAKRDSNGVLFAGDRSRKIDVHLWYPAAKSNAPAMTVKDYITSDLAPNATAEDRGGRERSLRSFFGQFGGTSDTAFQRLLGTVLLARRNASAAAGKFPLLVGQLRPFSTTVTNELLASHGYVVAMTFVQNDNEPRDPALGLEVAVRDMELAIPEMRKLPYVSPTSLATFGFSGSGFSQILLAMRHPDIDAVADLESAIFNGNMMWPLYRGVGYDVLAMRVPFMHLYSVPLSRDEPRIADFDGMRYSTRYRYLVDAPGIHHWDFATEGMAASAVLRMRGDSATRLQQAFETSNRYLLAFFNAHVKKDSTALAWLRRDPVQNGVPQGLVTIKETVALKPAISPYAFENILRYQSIPRAMAALDAGHAGDPDAPVYQEATLLELAYRVLRFQQPTHAIAVFRKNLELHPGSSNAYDSLAEGLERTGAKSEALEVSRRGLEVLSTEMLTDARRTQLSEALSGRIRRLSSGG